MVRPLKAGIDYFPLDTNMEQDDKIALIEAKYGVLGFGVIIKIFKKKPIKSIINLISSIAFIIYNIYLPVESKTFINVNF